MAEKNISSIDSKIKLDKVVLRENIDFLALDNLNKYKEAVKLVNDYSKLLYNARKNIGVFERNLFEVYMFNRAELVAYIPEKDFHLYVANMKYVRCNAVEHIKNWDNYFHYTGDILKSKNFTPYELHTQNFYGYAHFERPELKQYFVDHINKAIYVLGMGVNQKIDFDKENNRLVLTIDITTSYETQDQAWTAKYYKYNTYTLGIVTICLTSNRIMKHSEIKSEIDE